MTNRYNTVIEAGLPYRIRADVNDPIMDGIPHPYWLPEVVQAQTDRASLFVLDTKPGDAADVCVAGVPNYDFKWVDSSWLEAA